MSTWWRSHAVALVSIAILLPALAAILLGLPATQNDPESKSSAQGERKTIAGYSWTLALSDEFDDTETATPDGLALVAAIIEIEPVAGSAGDAGCDVRLVKGERSWPVLANPEDYGYSIAASSDQYCSLSGEAVELEVVFLVPEGTRAGSAIEVDVAGSPAPHRFTLG